MPNLGTRVHPQRIQRKRAAGWRMPDGAVYVGRPTVWGNPYVVHEHIEACYLKDLDCPLWPASSRTEAVRLFRHALDWPVIGDPRVPHPDDIRAELAGLDLACWCRLDQPCHADVLLELANGGAA